MSVKAYQQFMQKENKKTEVNYQKVSKRSSMWNFSNESKVPMLSDHLKYQSGRYVSAFTLEPLVEERHQVKWQDENRSQQPVPQEPPLVVTSRLNDQ